MSQVVEALTLQPRVAEFRLEAAGDHGAAQGNALAAEDDDGRTCELQDEAGRADAGERRVAAPATPHRLRPARLRNGTVLGK